MKRLASARAVTAMIAALASSAASAELSPETLSIAQFPPLTAHSIIVSSYESLSMRSYVIDGDAGEVRGLLPGSYNSMIRVGPGGDFYSADTYYAKLWRGKRTDQITVMDGKTAAITKEIEIPPNRFQSYTLNTTVDFTEGGRYLLQYNMTPAGSVTVVDPQAGKVLTEIPTAGCGLVFPYAPSAFAMLCADGGMLRIGFDDQGKVERKQVAPFFDPENDPLMQNGVAVPEKDLGIFVSYEGMIHELDLAGPKTYASKPWSVRGKGEEGWWPSGWEPIAYNARLDTIYVLMSETQKWDHPTGGHEVWAFNRKTHERLYRMKFEELITSIAVSPDDAPQLYALTNENDTILYVADAKQGKMLRQVEELGSYPFVLVSMPGYALAGKQ